MKLLITLCLTFVVATSAQTQFDDEVWDFNKGTPRACITTGPVCMSCTQSATCIEVGGVITEHAINPCPAGETCLGNACSTEANPPCGPEAAKAFVCNAVGMFPHPFDCKKFYMCVPATSGTVITAHSVDCPNGYRYNPKSTYCDVKIQNNLCYPPGEPNKFPVPPCTFNGQVGTQFENPSIYYLCEFYGSSKDLYPYLHLCKYGLVFDPAQLKCVPESTITTDEPSTTTPNFK